MADPRVSVVIPAYRCADTIGKALAERLEKVREEAADEPEQQPASSEFEPADQEKKKKALRS
mgnify:CR=1 FL=1